MGILKWQMKFGIFSRQNRNSCITLEGLVQLNKFDKFKVDHRTALICNYTLLAVQF